MGGGCGISVHGSHRVVTETTQLAMPECRIGLFPDIGASYFLARCPGEIGLYLGLTGARIVGADAIYLGLADYYIPNKRLTEIIPTLADGEAVSAALGALATPSGAAPLSMLREDIDAVFALDNVHDIIRALESYPDAWARQAYSDIKAACPLSLELTFRSIREARTKTLRECLVSDFRIALRLMQRDDYFEGVRARIIDKDNRPRWSHSSVQDVPQEEVDACFAPLGPSELQFQPG